MIIRTSKYCTKTALELYQWNGRLAASFLFPMHIYEVVLRNTVSEAIALRYGTDWPVHPAFQSSLPARDRKVLLGSLHHYRHLDGLIPALKLSWIENMFTKRHEARIWQSGFHYVFPHAPAADIHSMRARLMADCAKIRTIRNRIAHHEPIFNQHGLREIMPSILNAIGWRSPDTQQWLLKTGIPLQ